MSKPERFLFRSETVKGIKGGKKSIDRENNVIRGYAVISKGEAMGHGTEIDDTTLEQVVELGNKAKSGIKSRFGHPNMSSEALGTFLGRAKEFYRDGDIVRAELHLDKTAFNTPNGDLASYVMDLAESDPKSFGSSIVFDGTREPRLNEDGTVQRDKDGKELRPLVRVKRLWASDVVDDPAANEGMLSSKTFFTPDVKLSAEVTAFLDKFLQYPDAIEKVIKFLSRYAGHSEEIEDTTQTTPKTEVEGMDNINFKDITLEHLKLHRPDLILAAREEYKKEAEASVTNKKQEFTSAAINEERARCTAIMEEAEGFTTADESVEFGKQIRAAANAAVKEGSSKDAAVGQFQKLKIAALQKNKNPEAGAGADHVAGAPDGLQGEELWKWQYANVPSVGKEFSSEKRYVAFMKAETRGQVKTLKPKK